MGNMTTAHLPAAAGGRPAGPGRTLRERVRTAVRSVAESAVTPLDLDDLLDHFSPLRRGAELSGRVLEVLPETAQSATLVIKPGRDWAGHVPGQYVRVGVDVEGVRLWRTYSLTHGPRADGSISITVKAIEGGTVSNHLVHRTAPGTMLRLAQADGDFVLPQPLPAKLLLVTAGSGITPVIGMLRNLFSRATPPTTDIVLIHSALSRAEVIFAEEIRGYAARGLIRLVELHTDTDGLLDVDSLDELVPDLAERPTYACGPAGLLDALEAHHSARGLVLHTERFRPVTVAAPGEGGTVTFADGREVSADGSTPILDAAESAGVLMPSGCRMGICMGCVLPLKEGAVRDLRNGALTVAVPGETDPAGVPIQTCVSAPAGACSVDHS